MGRARKVKAHISSPHQSLSGRVQAIVGSKAYLDMG
jgi:hypothetical protein